MKTPLILLAALIIGGTGYVGHRKHWFGRAQQAGTVVSEDGPTAVVEKRDIDFSVRVGGDVQPATQLDVKAEVGGRIKKLHVEPGDVVKAGELLVEIDDRDILSELESSKTEIDGANFAVAKSGKNFERARDLYKEKLISHEVFDNLSSELDIARNSFKGAERKKQLVEDKLFKTKVIAPTDGTVLTVPVVEGQVVIPAASVNSGTTLMSIANLSRLIVETHVNQVDVGKLALKQEVKLMAEAIKDEDMVAEISFVAPVATNRNGIKGFTVQALIIRPGPRLRPGMTVQMTIPIAHADAAVAVPISAVFRGSGNSRVVYVRTGDRTERRTVKVGISNIDHAQILQGLREGEEVLLIGPEPARKRS